MYHLLFGWWGYHPSEARVWGGSAEGAVVGWWWWGWGERSENRERSDWMEGVGVRAKLERWGWSPLRGDQFMRSMIWWGGVRKGGSNIVASKLL